MKAQAIVYVDGFNLYKSALQKRFTEYKWLDVEKLADLLLPNLDVIAVKYFAAELKPRADDPQVVQRQRVYLRALSECDRTEVTLGHFQLHRTWLPVHPLTVDAETGRTRTVHVFGPKRRGLT